MMSCENSSTPFSTITSFGSILTIEDRSGLVASVILVESKFDEGRLLNPVPTA